LSIVKTKLKGHVQVIQEDNDELNAIDDEIKEEKDIFIKL
jgi:3-methyladenine DNA glycosylase AlkC